MLTHYPKSWFWVVKFYLLISVQGVASPVERDSTLTPTTTKPIPIQTKVLYDPGRNVYLLYFFRHPFLQPVPVLLTRTEYLEYTAGQMQKNYFRARNRQEFLSGTGSPLSIDYKDLPLHNRKTRRLQKSAFDFCIKGQAEINSGLKQIYSQNPSLPVRSRRQTYFEFDEKIRLNLHAGMGDKLSFDLNYDTETLLEGEQKKYGLPILEMKTN